MNESGQAILDQLGQVRELRDERTADPALGLRVQSIKVFQHERFARTYHDLLEDHERSGAARFFLDEIYGPTDFEQRDAEFARVVPALVRVFPAAIVQTVLTLIRLHALSESLDDAMATALSSTRCDESAYQVAWLRVGREPERRLQVELIAVVGRAMSKHTRSKLLRHSLKLMRGPAHAAGLVALQRFLERGFDTFGQLSDANGFIDLIVKRESDLITQRFNSMAP